MPIIDSFSKQNVIEQLGAAQYNVSCYPRTAAISLQAGLEMMLKLILQSQNASFNMASHDIRELMNKLSGEPARILPQSLYNAADIITEWETRAKYSGSFATESWEVAQLLEDTQYFFEMVENYL